MKISLDGFLALALVVTVLALCALLYEVVQLKGAVAKGVAAIPSAVKQVTPNRWGLVPPPPPN